ncbi:MAG: type I DNA topoisomerase [Bacteroidetes bacterium]|nr:type I DNA topoisomerase [Bacteroidota bacterium]MCH8524589.1 type I DNA topoisomerase [Balneolales bacterium]
MKSLVIVESPTKAKTIRKFLDKNFTVDSSYGHIRDLPASAKEIPAKFKKEKWANLGINTDDDFEPLYVISAEKKKVVKKLKDLLKDSDELILATDEDREGEGIAWHILEVLKPKVPVKRMVFHEITKDAINRALENFRDINMNLVDAQETRRVVDRLAGYTISPLLWKKIAPGLSAGRVQSVAVELLVQRERERMRFRSGSYWDLRAKLSPQGEKSTFVADLVQLNGKRLATGKDFDESTGKLSKPDAVVLLDQKQAFSLKEQLETNAGWTVTALDSSVQERSPGAPFTTSTLQQEANRKFGFSAKDTMRTAQKLYEEGYITYMRTDSTTLSGQAINAAREAVASMYGENYLYKSVRSYNKKAKGAQEAHEAIRPAGSHFRAPQDTPLSGRELKLYDLIWKRTMATQMANARLEFTTATITAAIEGDGKSEPVNAEFRSTGKKILFPGFFRAYVEGSDDPAADLEDQEKPLPDLKQNDKLDPRSLEALSHETKPPARFTEASLVKQLEKEGVGRPSTYASIIDTILNRGYTQKQGNALVPTFTAFAVTELLEKYFPDLVDVQFTSEMENKLDEIATGNEDRTRYLERYYGGETGLKQMVEQQESQIIAADARKIDLPLEGLEKVDVFVGRYGPYAQLNDNGETVSASLPVDLFPGDITVEKLHEIIRLSEEGPSSLGKDPETGQDIYLLSGRFGPYVQLGEVTDDNKKPKRTSLLKGMKPEDVDLDTALRLLALPRPLGNHPDSGKEIRAGVGRFGPYVVHDGTFKSLGKDDNVLTVDLDRAVALLAEAKKTKRGSSALKDLGPHPESGDNVSVMTGRYGPYIKYGKNNVSIPKGTEPEDLTMEQAIGFINDKLASKK